MDHFTVFTSSFFPPSPISHLTFGQPSRSESITPTMSTKRKAPMSLPRPTVKTSAKVPTKSRVDESMAAVSTSGSLHPHLPPSTDTIEISSDSSSSYGDISDKEEDPESENENNGSASASSLKKGRQITPPPDHSIPSATRKPSQGQNNALDTDVDMMAAGDENSNQVAPTTTTTTTAAAVENDDDEGTAPTFGDLLRGSAAGATIDVAAALAAPTSLLASASQQQQQRLQQQQQPPSPPPPPTLSSLGTVLNQALRTDDAALLESCLHTTDVPTVRATIQRMESSLAATLLARLAARMYHRPARAHTLMVWVQWTLVAHGGALAAQPDLVRRLAELNRVLEDRARALPSLLALKGKLDMLDSQMQLRRENLTSRRAIRGSGGGTGSSGLAIDGRAVDGEEDEDIEGDGDGVPQDEVDGAEEVIYVEGQEGDDETPNGNVRKNNKNKGSDDEEAILVNGVGGETDDDSDEDEDEADADSSVDGEMDGPRSPLADGSEVDFDPESSDDEEDEVEEVAAPPAKIRKVATQPRRK